MPELPPTVRAPRSLGYLAPCVLILGLYLGAFAVQDTLEHARVAYLLDVGVFCDTGRAIAEGFPLYSEEFPTRSGFRFIYPPFAAGLFVPLTWIAEERMEAAWTIATIAAVVAVVCMACHRLGLRRWWMWGIGLAGFALLLDPIQRHLLYGQVNIFLALLITADVLGYIPRRLRGLGIGVAAGIKITPAAYALLFLVRRDWWSLARAVVFSLLTVAIGFAIRAEDSWYYWTTEFFSSDRGGPPAYPPNQALTGLIARLGVADDTASAIMGPGFLLIAALTVWGAWKLTWLGRHVDALLLVLLGISLANPVAVTHHWSGMVIALPLLFVPLNRRIGLATLFFLAANFAGLWIRYADQPFYSFEFPGWFVYNLQGLSGLLLFVLYLFVRRHPQPTQSPSPRGADASPAHGKTGAALATAALLVLAGCSIQPGGSGQPGQTGQEAQPEGSVQLRQPGQSEPQQQPGAPDHPDQPGQPGPDGWELGEGGRGGVGVEYPVDAAAAQSLLATLEVKGRAPKTGYERAQFGQRWKDIDRNGCDQRNDVLARDLTEVDAPKGCKVLSGVLADPYTGQRIDFLRGQKTSSAVQIDHVVALADAWQKGAQQLSPEEREALGNDPLNLLAVDGPTNQAKGAGDAATWLPPNKAFRCRYVATQTEVKAKYRLWVTPAERDAIAGVLANC